MSIAAKRENPDQIDPRRLGAWCRANANRIVDGLKLRRESADRHHAATWRVVNSGSSNQTDQNRAMRMQEGENNLSGGVPTPALSEQPEINSPNSPDPHRDDELKTNIDDNVRRVRSSESG